MRVGKISRDSFITNFLLFIIYKSSFNNLSFSATEKEMSIYTKYIYLFARLMITEIC